MNWLFVSGVPENSRGLLANLSRDTQCLITQDFPGGPVVENPPVNAGDMASISGLERFYMSRGN